MSAWTWVLIGLCVAGLGLAVGSAVPVLLAALRLRSKMQTIRQRELFLSLESLKLQQARLSKVSADVQPIAARAQAAITSIKESVQESGLAESKAALDQTGAEIHQLYEDLR